MLFQADKLHTIKQIYIIFFWGGGLTCYATNNNNYLIVKFFRENQTRDLGNYRSKVIELEAEIERVKRQLTNERFER